MKWTVTLWKDQGSPKSPVEKELAREVFGNRSANKVFLKMIKLLQEFGNELQMPHSKYLGEGIYELRDKSNGKRYCYTFTDHVMKDREQENLIILFGAVGAKSRQNADIERAKNRFGELGIENIFNPKQYEILHRKESK
ncbi:MAG: type II toxin-antitoxin system RelE/ParE family toxin [Deltaproteobacteria bacterium]|nr:type II toxin-antitoxin system RelE/ParE family toxin [Deltaproteobacteria bacterium]